MSESNTGVPQAMLTQQRAPGGSVVNLTLPPGSWVHAPAAVPWLITQCPTLDAAQITQLGKDGWEPFSVHTGPDAVPRIWWRKREWGP